LMIPVATLVSTLFTIGIMSKNSEITAMRAAGVTLFWLARPIFISAFIFSVLSIIANETIVPSAQQAVREIYNIDIRKKDVKGSYSQEDFWWRSGDSFYAANLFDSRNNTLYGFSEFKIDKDFHVNKRTDAASVEFLNPTYKWSMIDVTEYEFQPDAPPKSRKRLKLPLTISDQPKDFFNVNTDPDTMSFFQLSEFIKKQESNGLSVKSYLADLYAKVSFPFVTFIVSLIALPFALTPARSGSLAFSFLSGIVIGFSYYAVHSFSISLGRAEFWPPLLAAWMATILLGAIGAILNLGAESPH
ncbi:MAG: LptF/LptG family permease, partial [Bdellovibrionales bacterium]|nr:LptF/LptG family permease [Bdellovibrionales bacterium]